MVLKENQVRKAYKKPTNPFQVEVASPLTPKMKSIAKMQMVNISVVINTNTVLSCNSAQDGQVTS
jgi:hypothetical protein